MPLIADYIVLHDGPFELDSIPDGTVPVAKNLNFDLPGNFVQGTNRARPILQFIFAAKSHDGKFGYWVNANESALVDGSQTGRHFWPERIGPEVSTWECLQGDKFLPGRSNRIRFGFEPSQNATLIIRDVVLWFQRDVNT